MADTTYCPLFECPFRDDCTRHISNAPRPGHVYVAALYRTCRRYVGWLVDKATEQNWWRHHYERKEE